MKSFSTLTACSSLLATSQASPLAIRQAPASDLLKVGPSIVEVSPTFRSVLPVANFNRNVTVPWWSTGFLNGSKSDSTSAAFKSLVQAHFVVFDQDFYRLLGTNSYKDNKTIENIFEFPPGPSFANRIVHDGTVYSPECNCIYFVELHPPKAGFSADAMPWIWRINLNGTSKPVTEKVYPQPPLTMGNGAYYHNGSIYFAQEGNYTTPGGIVRMDPVTLQTEVVLNNFLGHRFNSPNDVVVTKGGVAYFTDGYYGYANFNDTLVPEIANGVWRWDMKSGDLRQVVSASTGIFLNPNGVALSPGDQKLYVTARGETSADPAGQRNIYDFDIAKDFNSLAVKYNGVHSYSDAGFPDGVKVDAEGRVYGGVTGGVNVWAPSGKFLGIIKVAEDDVAVNMQFVNNWLYIAGRTFVYRVQLSTKSAQIY